MFICETPPYTYTKDNNLSNICIFFYLTKKLNIINYQLSILLLYLWEVWKENL
jgi:hypothetical protein